MKIVLASDHGGYALKNAIKSYLCEQGIYVTDVGTHSAESCDYPDYAQMAAEMVASGRCTLGIVVCTTGIGVSIVANKVKGIRCALCHSVADALLCRQHNDANMLALGAASQSEEEGLRIVTAFLNGSFEGGRHERRVNKITALEEKNFK